MPIPRFVSLRSDKVFARTGPALRYPIKWVYVRSGMPIEIIQEFDTWRKVRDIKGEEGEKPYEVAQGDYPSHHGDPVVPLKCAGDLSRIVEKHHQ